LGEPEGGEDVVLLLLELHDGVLQGHCALQRLLEVFRKAAVPVPLGEEPPALFLVLIGEGDCLGLEVGSEDGEDAADVLKGGVVEVHFSLQFGEFFLDVEFGLFGRGFDGGFNYVILLLPVGVVRPEWVKQYQ
jgi:hypothetical protein